MSKLDSASGFANQTEPVEQSSPLPAIASESDRKGSLQDYQFEAQGYDHYRDNDSRLWIRPTGLCLPFFELLPLTELEKIEWRS